jgi:hypothetical protein
LLHDRSDVHVTTVQLSAFNTPQFGWAKSRLSRKAQPVPPIYQPEIAAEAIVWAAYNKRRELYVGYPAVKTIVGNKLAPWYAERVLAREGFESQQQDEPEDPDRPHNLFEPVPGDHGAHGGFDAEASDFSVQLWLTTHRGLLLFAAGSFIAGAAVGILLGRGPSVADT